MVDEAEEREKAARSIDESLEMLDWFFAYEALHGRADLKHLIDYLRQGKADANFQKAIAAALDPDSDADDFQFRLCFQQRRRGKPPESLEALERRIENEQRAAKLVCDARAEQERDPTVKVEAAVAQAEEETGFGRSKIYALANQRVHEK